MMVDDIMVDHPKVVSQAGPIGTKLAEIAGLFGKVTQPSFQNNQIGPNLGYLYFEGGKTLDAGLKYYSHFTHTI